jgi:LPXTG-motif cell wall-anchored protein
MTTAADHEVSRAEIEAKLREIQGEATSTGDTAKTALLVGGAVAAVAVVGLVFLLGKRRGKKKRTVVEIRRV